MKCDICEKSITKVVVDGKMKFGPWAYMCLDCFEKYGVGLGIGKGQKYDVATLEPKEE
jgi:hypothetical protein